MVNSLGDINRGRDELPPLEADRSLWAFVTGPRALYIVFRSPIKCSQLRTS